MPQLWRTSAMAVIATISFSGCAGQQLEGRWRGPFPLEDAKSCVLNLYSNRTFDLACGGDAWIGAGRYARANDDLRFEFTVLHRHRAPEHRLPNLSVSLEGHGNEIVLTNSADQKYRLRRGL